MTQHTLCIQHPAGLTNTAAEVEQQLTRTKNWEDRYRVLIAFGKKLPELDAEFKIEDNLIQGCESKAWLLATEQEGIWHFAADSQARIVRGLLFVLLCAINHKDTNFIQTFDLESYFATLSLDKHLSASRVNGLQSVYHAILSTLTAE